MEKKKRSKIRDYDFEGDDILRSTPSETQEEVTEILPSQEDTVAEEEKEAESVAAETNEKIEISPEAERKSEIERIFASYPATAELLSQAASLPIDGSTERFMASVEGFARGRGLESDELDRALVLLFGIGAGCLSGALTLEMVETLIKGTDYDRVLAEEIHAAELRGRNANIEARMREISSGDGVPHLESRGTSAAKRNRGIFSLAEDARR